MSLVHQPGVRIVLGYAGRAERPPATYASPATLALQKAVATLGKDWKRVAPMFIVAPAAGSGRVVVGLAMSRVPVILDAPRMLGPNTAIAKEHFVAQSNLRPAPDVDKYGNTRADEGILKGLAAGAADPALSELGLSLEDEESPPAHFLVSDDGRAGALVFGQAIWKLGGAYEGGSVRTWTRDYGGGEGVRLVGVSYAEVGPDAPVARLDVSRPALDAHRTAATTAVRALLDTQVAWSWELVCDDAPGPFVAPEPAVDAPKAKKRAKAKPKTKARAVKPSSETFVAQPLEALVAALAALGEPGTELAAQTLDLPGVVRAYSHEDLSSAADRPPHPALYELREAPDAAALGEPAKLLARAFVREALGTWNANASGKWASGADWLVADLELVSEQEDEAVDTRVSAIVALFAIEGGWAGAVWPAHRHEELATVLGFDPWARATWRAVELWLGE